MQIYLPIAEMSVNIFAILALGGITGVLAGMFGVGGGFLMTPFLIFIGIPPAIAVASSANQIIAASVSGFLAHWRRQNVDFRMGWLLMLGGMIGSTLGVGIFRWLEARGQIDLVISLCYVVFLGGVGSFMAMESGRNLVRARQQQPARMFKAQLADHPLIQRLPLKIRFPRSKLHISVILPLLIGFGVGVLISLMGIGGGFLMIPAMIYLLGMPTTIVVGTSLFQIIFTTANVTFLQAITTHTVDVVLAMLLLCGSVVGAQVGTRIGARMPAEQLRGFLALIVLSIALKLAYGLFATPSDLFSVIVREG